MENKFKKPSLYVDVEISVSGNASDRPWDDRSDLEIRYEQLKADIQELKTIIKEMSDHSKGYGHCGMDMFAHTKWRKFAEDLK